MSCSPTSLPTDRPDPYYQYRLTVPHVKHDEVVKFITQYSKDWAFCKHFPDDLEDGCKQEHFHAVFRDFSTKTVDAFRKAVSKHFARAGNGLHAGKFQTNHVSKSIGYFKHDEHAEIFHSGQSYWQEYIDTEPAFTKSAGPRKLFKESMSHPVLTYANVLKQALKHRAEHCPSATTLYEVVDDMVGEHKWYPSRELLTNGIPIETHEWFSDVVSKKRPRMSFYCPHVRSEKKLEWTDKIAPGFYPGGVSSSGMPGSGMTGSVGVPSRRLWKDKDFSDPSSI